MTYYYYHYMFTWIKESWVLETQGTTFLESCSSEISINAEKNLLGKRGRRVVKEERALFQVYRAASSSPLCEEIAHFLYIAGNRFVYHVTSITRVEVLFVKFWIFWNEVHMSSQTSVYLLFIHGWLFPYYMCTFTLA